MKTTVEQTNNVHSSVREQVKDRKKTTARQYSEFAQLDNSRYVASETVEEVDNYKMKILEG